MDRTWASLKHPALGHISISKLHVLILTWQYSYLKTLCLHQSIAKQTIDYRSLNARTI